LSNHKKEALERKRKGEGSKEKAQDDGKGVLLRESLKGLEKNYNTL